MGGAVSSSECLSFFLLFFALSVSFFAFFSAFDFAPDSLKLPRSSSLSCFDRPSLPKNPRFFPLLLFFDEDDRYPLASVSFPPSLTYPSVSYFALSFFFFRSLFFTDDDGGLAKKAKAGEEWSSREEDG